jgi:hypothetical protein
MGEAAIIEKDDLRWIHEVRSGVAKTKGRILKGMPAFRQPPQLSNDGLTADEFKRWQRP